MIRIADFVAGWPASVFAGLPASPWEATSRAEALIRKALSALGAEYRIADGIAIHASAIIEVGAIVKAPAIIGPDCLVAASAYLRGGVFLDRGCIVGPACEVKSTFLFQAAKVAHLSFVGDSIIGARTNIEAGAILANYRNEMVDKRIRILHRGEIIDTGIDKFGTLVGDDARIGANAVIAPGALLDPGARVGRLAHIDQHPTPID